MSKRELYYATAVFVIAAIAATTFAIWTVYFLPRNTIDNDARPDYPSFPYFPEIPKGLTLDDHHNRS
jgi:hypothetical protein